MRTLTLFVLSLAPVAAMAHPGHGPELDPAAMAGAGGLFALACLAMAAAHALQRRRGV